MNSSSSLTVTVAQRKPASREHRQFERLVAQIEQKRDQLKEWQAFSLRYNQRIFNELDPLRAQFRAAQQKLVGLIDELLTRSDVRRPLGRVQRIKLRALLMNLLADLLDDARDEALEEIYDRYSDVPREEDLQADLEITEAFLKDVMGVDVGDDHGASNSEELLHYAREKMKERAADEPDEQAEAARPAKRDKADGDVKKSLREVFRKLVSALHPDREPDPEARQRKTVLMQRVNQAYEADDLLTLLGMQLEIEQINAADLSSASRERLGQYNQLLRRQLQELNLELENCIEPFRQNLRRRRGQAITIVAVERDLSAACARLSKGVRNLRADLVNFRDPDRLRQVLANFDFESEPEPDDPDELSGTFEVAPPRRTKRRRR